MGRVSKNGQDYEAECYSLGTLWTSCIHLLASDVLQIGPFLDGEHPLIKNGDMDKTPAVLFRENFLDRLSEVLDDVPGSIALVVPSVRDVLGDHAVFPQCEFELAHDPVSPQC